MFNPYSIRPIGSDRFEQHIKDVETSAYYDRVIVDDDDPLKLAVYGTKIWKSENDNDPYEKLITAMVVQAVIDYVGYFLNWQRAQEEGDQSGEVLWHSRMLDEENDFFRRYEITEYVFEELLKLLFSQKHDSIKRNNKRIIKHILHNYYDYKKKKGWE